MSLWFLPTKCPVCGKRFWRRRKYRAHWAWWHTDHREEVTWWSE